MVRIREEAISLAFGQAPPGQTMERRKGRSCPFAGNKPGHRLENNAPDKRQQRQDRKLISPDFVLRERFHVSANRPIARFGPAFQVRGQSLDLGNPRISCSSREVADAGLWDALVRVDLTYIS